MSWDISFISERDFRKHVELTIKQYGDKLAPYNLKKFNNNIVDPIKLIFDKTVYRYSWKKSFGMKSSASATNQTTMTSAIFTNAFSNILRDVPFLHRVGM